MSRKRRKQKQIQKRATRAAAQKKFAKKPEVKKKIVKTISSGRVYIKATFNNTIVTFTDNSGNVLASASAGQCGFRGPKKVTPYAANIIVKEAASRVEPYGLKNVDIFVKGVGSGRDAAIRAIYAQRMNILSIKDITPIPHDGCRPPKPRRV
ncbi:MAG: 30S ribosomal protein S11 [Parcubacteria group bacterium ADurb.Bin159]|jgi:small subunit ribosomal protein S11|nr:MAG: 30S ribosomal protein S11 [Parcubacteria group bacterium ADurb.Bin159]